MMYVVGTLTTACLVMACLQFRELRALRWMVGGAIVFGVGFAVRLAWPSPPAIVLGNGAMGAAAGCLWLSCRVACGRRPLPWILLAPLGVWLAFACIPAWFHPISVRIAVAMLTNVAFNALAIRELCRRWDGSLARAFVTAVLVLHMVTNAAWLVANILTPIQDNDNLLNATGFAFVPLSVIVFHLLVSFGMVAVVQEQAGRQSRQAAFIDALTGLGNRREFEERLIKAFHRARRLAEPLAAIMIDADNFKCYNDLYGHVEGDSCLRLVAQAMRSSLARRDDIVLRYGGEEFVVLLPNTTATQAKSVGERLRQTIRGLRLPHAGAPSGWVTVSLGVAVMDDCHTMTDPTALVRAADNALYMAKKLGRDRVVVAEGALSVRNEYELTGL